MPTMKVLKIKNFNALAVQSVARIGNRAELNKAKCNCNNRVFSFRGKKRLTHARCYLVREREVVYFVMTGSNKLLYLLLILRK